MAIQTRKLKNGTIRYRVCWRNPITGKLEFGLWTSKAAAERLDDETKVRLKHDKASFKPEEEQPEVIRVADVLLLYHSRAERAEITKKMDFYHLRQVVSALGDLEVGELARRHLQNFEDEQRKSGVKQNTIQRRLSILRAALNWCVEREFLTTSPMAGYKLKRGQDERFIPPTPAEVSAIIANAPDHIIRAVVLGYNLGLRIGPSELFALQWDSFRLDETPPVAIFRASSKNPDEQWRKVPIKVYLLPWLRRWRAEDTLQRITWCIHFHGEPVKSMKRAWKTALEKAGITRRVRPYDLRHAFATYILEAGADAGTAAKLMGHSDASMIYRHYQHVLNEQKERAIQGLPELSIGDSSSLAAANKRKR